MTVITTSHKELGRIQASLTDLADGRISVPVAAGILDLSRRQALMLKAYRTSGADGLIL
jgi:hypothetical protein